MLLHSVYVLLQKKLRSVLNFGQNVSWKLLEIIRPDLLRHPEPVVLVVALVVVVVVAVALVVVVVVAVCDCGVVCDCRMNLVTMVRRTSVMMSWIMTW